MTSTGGFYFNNNNSIGGNNISGRDNDDNNSGLRHRNTSSNSIDRRNTSAFGLDGIDEPSSSSSSFADTPINDRRKPPIKSITNNVDMTLFTSPGARSATKLGIRSSPMTDNTPTNTRRTPNNRRSMMYNENTTTMNNAYHSNPITTPNRQIGLQQSDNHHQQLQQHTTTTNEPAYNTTDKAYHYWVLVSGLNNNDNQSISSILLHFQEYGDICEHLIGKGNWVFLRFTSPSAASDSLRANRDIINNNIIIVEKLDVTLAHKLSVKLDNGILVSTDTNNSSNINNSSRINSSRNTPNDVARVSFGEGLFDQNAAYKDFMSPINRYHHHHQVDRREASNPLYMSTPNRYLQPPIKKKSCCKMIMEVFGLNY